MHVPLFRCVAAALMAAILLPSCTTRSVPTRFPPGSAASQAAPEAAARAVAIALREDPPLPGDPTDAWQGLDDARQAAEGARDVPQPSSPQEHRHGR